MLPADAGVVVLLVASARVDMVTSELSEVPTLFEQVKTECKALESPVCELKVDAATSEHAMGVAVQTF